MWVESIWRRKGEERRRRRGEEEEQGRREEEGRRGEGEEKESRGEEEGRREEGRRRGQGEADDRHAPALSRHAERSSPFSPRLAEDEGDPDSTSPDYTATQGKAPLPPVAGLRAISGLVGLRAFCGCVGHRAICRCVGHRAEIVDVGHRAVFFLAGFGSLPVQGRFCRNFELINCVSCFAEKSPTEGTRSTPSVFLRVCLHRVTSPLHRHPRYKPFVRNPS